MTDFLSVTEARKHTGKSESTIKRMIREIANDSDHDDRGLILPSHDELEKRKAAKEPYVWKIAKALLDKRYPAQRPGQDGGHGAGASTTGPNSSYVTLLEQTNADLRSQNERQLDLISELTDNQRQSNVLVKSLTDILSGNGSVEAINVLNMSLHAEPTNKKPVVEAQTVERKQPKPSIQSKEGSESKTPLWQKDMFWFVNKRFRK